MNIGIIIQARMGSTRLPGKILKPFYKNQSILDILLANLKKVKGAKIIVATSTNKNNDELETYLHKKGELIFRGSENDVLERFIKTAEKYEIDGIIRICSDNPFLDWKGVEILINKAKDSKSDYVGYKINQLPSIKTHFGFWGEFVTLDALRKVYSITNADSAAHEHVTIHVYTHPEVFKCDWIQCPDFLRGRDDIRLTIDTYEDMMNAQKVYAELMKRNSDFNLHDVVEFLDEHTEIINSMKGIINNNQK